MESAASLVKLRLSELQKKARACGVPSDQVDDAADADDPRQELVRLILGALEASGAALRAELAELKLGALQKRARAAGGDSDRVDDAADADDPRTELITMILELHQGPQPQAAAGGGGGEALTLVPQHLPSPSLAGTPATSEGVPPTPLSSTSFSSPHATLTRHHSYGAEALREAGHVVLHQHHLEDTMGFLTMRTLPSDKWRRPKQPPLSEFLASVGCKEAEATIRANAFDTVEDLLDARLEEADLKDLGCTLMNPRKKMLHALRDLAMQLHEQEQRQRQKQGQPTQHEGEGMTHAGQGDAAMVIAAVSATDAEAAKEGVPSSAGDTATSTDSDRDRQMQGLQAENARLRQKLETMRQLLGVRANPSGDS